MKIGLIDVDNHNNLQSCFPNLPLMKLSAYHKKRGNDVEWYDKEKSYDAVYMSKVFSFTPNFDEEINTDVIFRGGTGYNITLLNGKEIFQRNVYLNLSYSVEHIYPDYSLYNIEDTAYGFMSRGCPRGCGFCHVKAKEGGISCKVADLNEFWKGQKYIELLDPNTLACSEWKNILQQLIDSGAYVNFNQGLDIRMLTLEKMNMLKEIKIKHIHFAYDRFSDQYIIEPMLKAFKEQTGWNRDKVSVYVLCNFNTTIEEDLKRIMFIRSLNFNPYVMRYDKEHIKRGSLVNALARWVNNKFFFWKYETFGEYLEATKKGLTR